MALLTILRAGQKNCPARRMLKASELLPSGKVYRSTYVEHRSKIKIVTIFLLLFTYHQI